MDRKSGTRLSRGKRERSRVSYTRLFSPRLTALIAFGLMVSANGPTVNASRSDAVSKSNHNLYQVRLHGSRNLASEFLTLQVQQSGTSAQSLAQAPKDGSGAGASR